MFSPEVKFLTLDEGWPDVAKYLGARRNSPRKGNPWQLSLLEMMAVIQEDGAYSFGRNSIFTNQVSYNAKGGNR